MMSTKPGFREAVAIGIVFIVLVFVNSTLSSFLCSSAIHNITMWKIDEASAPAQIIWQRSIVQDLNLITLSQNHVLVTENPTGVYPLCGTSTVALDLLTGTESWRYPATPKYVTSSTENAVESYFLWSCCTNIVRLNPEGRQIWSLDIPDLRPRNTALFPTSEIVFFPTGSQTLQIASETGQLLETTEDGLLAAYDDLLIFRTESRLRLVDLETGQQQSVIQLPTSNSPSSTVERFEGYLILHFGVYEIYAYHIETGELLWTMNQEQDAVHRIIGDKLVTYTPDDVIHFLALETGEEIGHITLERIPPRSGESVHPYFPVWLDGYDDIVSLLFSDVDELVTIRTGLP